MTGGLWSFFEFCSVATVVAGVLTPALSLSEDLWPPFVDERPERIVNGVGTSDFPAVGMLLKRIAGQFDVWCTGTLVASDKVLTAAHCIAEHPVSSNYSMFFQAAGLIQLTDIEWMEEKFDFPEADIAILTLARPISEFPPVAVNEFGPVPLGSQGTIVGFGRTGGMNVDYGIKRQGFITTTDCPTGPAGSLICWTFDAPEPGESEQSNTCNADSGGPLLMLSPTDQATYIIVGVTSGGLRRDCLAGDRSYDADVFAFVDFIRTALASSAAATTPLEMVSLDGEVVALSESLPSKTMQIQVPFGASKVTVALNAEENATDDLDFDLIVTKGVATAFRKPDCDRSGDRRVAFCSFDENVSGKYTIQLNRAHGEGLAQVTVAAFQ